VKVAREKTVTDFAWAVARRGRVGCGMEDQARVYRSGWKGGRGVMVAVVGGVAGGNDVVRGAVVAMLVSIVRELGGGGFGRMSEMWRYSGGEVGSDGLLGFSGSAPEAGD
jgi:hypothetical protein